MFRNMFKSVVKMFLPKPSAMAKMAAEKICKSLNGCDMMLKVAEYSKYADQATKIQQQLVDMLADGKLDSAEEEEISKMIQPLFEKVVELI